MGGEDKRHDSSDSSDDGPADLKMFRKLGKQKKKRAEYEKKQKILAEVKVRESAGDKHFQKCVHCSKPNWRDLNGIDEARTVKSGKIGHIQNPNHGRVTNMIKCWSCN